MSWWNRDREAQGGRESIYCTTAVIIWLKRRIWWRGYVENHCDGDTLIKYKVNEYISTSAPGYSHSHSITATAAAATTNIIIFWKRSTTFCEIYSIVRYFQSLSLLFSMYYALTAFCNQCDVGYRSFFLLLSFYLRLSLSVFHFSPSHRLPHISIALYSWSDG